MKNIIMAMIGLVGLNASSVLFSQIEYLEHGVDAAIGGGFTVADGPGKVKGSGVGINFGSDRFTVGLSYATSSFVDQGQKEEVETGTFHVSMIENAPEKPVSMIVSIGYQFDDPYREVTFVAVSVSAFRRIMLEPSMAVIPEIGVAKLLPFGGSGLNFPPIFSGSLTVAIRLAPSSLLLAAPSVAYSDRKFTAGLTLGCAFGQKTGPPNP